MQCSNIVNDFGSCINSYRINFGFQEQFARRSPDIIGAVAPLAVDNSMTKKKQATKERTSTFDSSARKSVRAIGGSSTLDIKVSVQPYAETGEAQEVASKAGKSSSSEQLRLRNVLQAPLPTLPDAQNPLLKVSNLIKSSRKKQKLTQQQLADAVGVHISFIAHLETLREKDALPSYGRTTAIERTLGLKERELWNLTEAVRAFKGSKRAQAIKRFHDIELEVQGIIPKQQLVSENATSVLHEQVKVESHNVESISAILREVGALLGDLDQQLKVENVSAIFSDFVALIREPEYQEQIGLLLRQMVEESQNEKGAAKDSNEDDS